MKLSDIEIGDVIIAIYSEAQVGDKIGSIFIYLGDKKFYDIGSEYIDNDWRPMTSNFTYGWDQVSTLTLGGLKKGSIDKVWNKKLKMAIMKTFDRTAGI